MDLKIYDLQKKCLELESEKLELQENVDELKEKTEFQAQSIKALGDIVLEHLGSLPISVRVCKKRATTTVKMMDGSIHIVKRKKGEKDCLHTAICYAVTKSLIGSEMLNKLVKKAQYVEPKNLS